MANFETMTLWSQADGYIRFFCHCAPWLPEVSNPGLRAVMSTRRNFGRAFMVVSCVRESQQDISPKKVSKPYPGGQKNVDKPAFLLS